MADETEFSDAELWEQTNDDDDETKGHAYYQISVRNFNRSEFEQAMAPASMARDLFAKIGDASKEGGAAYHEGMVFWRLERYQEAIEAFDLAAVRYRISATEEMLADAILAKARCLTQLKEVDEASLSFLSAANMYEVNKKYTLAGISLLELGDMQGSEGHQDKALETFTDSLRIFKLAGDLIGSGRAHDRIAAALIDLGRIVEAIANLREAHKIFEYIRDDERLAYAKFRLGWTLTTNNEYWEAIPLLRAAAEGYKQKQQWVDAAEADTQLAHALYNIGEFDEANELYGKTRTIYEASGQFETVLIADTNKATKLLGSDVPAAILMLRAILAQAKELDHKWLVKVTSVRLAEALNKLDTAAAYAEALELLEAISTEDWGNELHQLVRYLNARGETLFELDRDEEAKEYFERVVAFGYQTGFLHETGRAYGALASISLGKEDLNSSTKLLSLANAIYVLAGESMSAISISYQTVDLLMGSGKHYSDKSDYPNGCEAMKR